MRTRWRFGSKRRLVATIEWLRLWPNAGPFPHTLQTLDTAGEYSHAPWPASAGGELLFDGQRRERGGRCLAARVALGAAGDTFQPLLHAIDGEHTEAARDAGLELHLLDPP